MSEGFWVAAIEPTDYQGTFEKPKKGTSESQRCTHSYPITILT